MKIAFHDNSLSLRGTTVALYDYAYYTREIIGNESIILYNKKHIANNNDVYNKFKNQFNVYGYDNISEIDSILSKENCDSFLMLKGGKYDGIKSNVCRNLINAISVCNTSDIHGDIFAMGSKWLSKITNYQIPYVPYMVTLPNNEQDLRQYLNIPKDALVLGRNGGWETFDLSWVKDSILEVLYKRSDIYFIFQFTEPFIKHERVIFLPGTSDLDEKVSFINTCDAMLHARYIGESFGLSCAEFSIKNKPIITYSESPEKNHIDILGEKGIYYSNKNDILEILLSLDKKYLNSNEWNMYQDYTPEKVVEQFKNIYL
jgi:glycosyltransferase involved in cell wall biosynthesis